MDTKYISSLLDFLGKSPCNFCAVDTAKKWLAANGFDERRLDEKLNAKPGDKPKTTRPYLP